MTCKYDLEDHLRFLSKREFEDLCHQLGKDPKSFRRQRELVCDYGERLLAYLLVRQRGGFGAVMGGFSPAQQALLSKRFENWEVAFNRLPEYVEEGDLALAIMEILPPDKEPTIYDIPRAMGPWFKDLDHLIRFHNEAVGRWAARCPRLRFGSHLLPATDPHWAREGVFTAEDLLRHF
jgi:hypothetical protein